jgi:hypothetical protein
VGIQSLTTSGINNFVRSRSMLVGNEAFIPSQFELIETAILNENQASVIFNNLGQYSSTYRHLQIRLSARGNRATYSQDSLRIYLNGDTNLSNYTAHEFRGDGTIVTSFGEVSQNYTVSVDGSQSPTNAFGAGVVDILDAYSTTKNKSIRSFSGHASPAAGGATGSRVTLNSALWSNTASITSVRFDSLDSTIIANSRFSIYGIRG